MTAIRGLTVRRVLRSRLRRWRARHRAAIPINLGNGRLGQSRGLTPVSRKYGFDRGLPIDRWYIEQFLRRHSPHAGYLLGDIRGRVLEIGGRDYADRFGTLDAGQGTSAIDRLDVLHADSSNPAATIVGDLQASSALASDQFDCIICTQTLSAIYDVRAAIATLHRALAPGGVVLVTVPGITARIQPDADAWGDYWRFTTRSARALFEEAFPAAGVRVEGFGNLRSTVAFLNGLSAEDLTSVELELNDPDYEMLVAIRAVKSDE